MESSAMCCVRPASFPLSAGPTEESRAAWPGATNAASMPGVHILSGSVYTFPGDFVFSGCFWVPSQSRIMVHHRVPCGVNCTVNETAHSQLHICTTDALGKRKGMAMYSNDASLLYG